MDESLTFISPAILERVENGSFVPSRRTQSRRALARAADGSTRSGNHSEKSPSSNDRRNILSPLAVTKRCIRYEPNVFYQRKSVILEMAHCLNTSVNKIILLGGSQGCGKTSLARAVIELMGSRNEQLLWFDANRHTDFEEIIHFLIHYITSICANLGEHRSDVPPSSQMPAFKMDRRLDPTRQSAEREADRGDNTAPLARLERLLTDVRHVPLLLVLDNVEYLVDSELRFNSYPFKEMLNFLLAFPNIKMILVGERLPYADMSPNQEGVEDIQLAGLGELETLTLLQSKRKDKEEPSSDPGVLEWVSVSEAESDALRHLYRKTQGFPWLLKSLLHLNHQCRLDFYTLNRLLNPNPDVASNTLPEALPVSDFIRLIYERLPDQHRKLFQLLSFLRHPVDIKALQAMANVCYPVLGPGQLSAEALEGILEHSLLRSLLKINYPPQEVLAHIRQQREKQQATSASERPLSPFASERPVPPEQKTDNATETNTPSAPMHLSASKSLEAPTEAPQKFKPGYELYHVVKRILYHSIPENERDRIHGILQEFYLRARTQEAEGRLLRIKNRALLGEAKFHGSVARKRRPTERDAYFAIDSSRKDSDLGYRPQPSPSFVSHPSIPLDDHTRANPAWGDDAETTLSGPSFLERLGEEALKPSMHAEAFPSPPRVGEKRPASPDTLDALKQQQLTELIMSSPPPVMDHAASSAETEQEASPVDLPTGALQDPAARYLSSPPDHPSAPLASPQPPSSKALASSTEQPKRQPLEGRPTVEGMPPLSSHSHSQSRTPNASQASGPGVLSSEGVKTPKVHDSKRSPMFESSEAQHALLGADTEGQADTVSLGMSHSPGGAPLGKGVLHQDGMHSGDLEIEKPIQKRLAMAVSQQDKPAMVRELVDLARSRMERGQYDGAGQCLDKAIGLELEASQDVLAELYRLSGLVYKETYHHNAAMEALAKATKQIQRLMYEDETVSALWLGRLGAVYQAIGDIQAYRKQYEEAVNAFLQALRWYHSADDDAAEAEVHFQIAGVYDDLNEMASAIQHYEQACVLDEAHDNHLSAAASLSNLGNLYMASHRWTDALQAYQKALAHDRMARNTEGQLNTLNCLISLHLQKKDWITAKNTAQQALAIAVEAESRLWQATLYVKLGQLDIIQNNPSHALQHFERAYSTGAQELSQDSLHWLEKKISELRTR